MKYNPDIHHRRSIRLKDYDYSQAGLYFVTICTQGRHHLFGDVEDGIVKLTAAGEMVRTVWEQIPFHYPGVEIDQFVIMPNHFHGIVIIVGAGPRACPDGMGQPHPIGQPQGVAPTADIDGRSSEPGYSLPDVVHRFKTMTTKKYVDGVKLHGWQRFDGKLWQRNYWEHIIRNEREFNRIRHYIENNPIQWENDKLNGGSGNRVLEPQTEYGRESWMV